MRPAELDEDDIARMEHVDLALLEQRMAALARLRLAPGGADHRFARSVCLRLPEALTPQERHQVAVMAWRFRTSLPRALRPAINPADPLSADHAALRMGCTPTVALAHLDCRRA